VVAWKNKPDGTPDWQTISLCKGAYQIEDINTEIQYAIRSLASIPADKPVPVEIGVHVPTLSTSIKIMSPEYRIDIYNSSIRTVLGWPEKSPTRKESPKPKKSDYASDK
jgi:hypothetical protein